jgi:hypothetical protein
MSGGYPGGPLALDPYPLDWHPLAPADPVPGDPAAVHDLARTMAARAEVARRSAGTLARHGGLPSWGGAAADAFAGIVLELPPLLERVAARYGGAAQALTAYATELARARSQARAALGVARAASPDLVAARRGLAEAVETRERAVGAAAARLEAVAHDGLRDHRSLSRLLGQAAHAAADFAVDTAHLQDVSAGLGIAALLTAWCPPVAGALEIGALATGGLALAAQAELARSGDGSWSAVGASAAGVALFGVGRVYGATTRAAAAVGRAERAVLAAGADAQLLADANAAVAAARANLPRLALVPRRAHLAEASPRRVARDVRDDWHGRGTPRPSARTQARETTEALRGRLGVAVAANTAVKVAAGAESKRRTASDAVPD